MISPFDSVTEIFEVEAFSHDLFNIQVTETFLQRVKETLTNDHWPLAIVFYSSPFRLPASFFRLLNSFAESIKNPLLLCVGDDFNNFNHNELKFVLSRHRYFEFEAKTLWERNSKQSIEFTTSKSKKFLYATLKDFPERKFLLANIINNGHLHNGYVGFARKVVTDYSNELLHHNTDVKLVADSINNKLPLPNLDEHGDWVRMSEEIRTNSYLNITTDTFFHLEPSTLFLSEKVFNAMAFGQLFMYLGPCQSLKYLQSIGYETFNDYIDESYDEIYDPFQRLLAFNRSMLDFISKPIDQIEQIYKQCMPKLVKNRDKLFASNFKKLVLADLESARFFKNK